MTSISKKIDKEEKKLKELKQIRLPYGQNENYLTIQPNIDVWMALHTLSQRKCYYNLGAVYKVCNANLAQPPSS